MLKNVIFTIETILFFSFGTDTFFASYVNKRRVRKKNVKIESRKRLFMEAGKD